MVVKLTERERGTVLAALRRWRSYPAAREADPTATNRGKHKPLDDGEIQRLANASAKWQGAATLRSCVVIQTMVPVCRNIQKLRDDQLDVRDLH